MKKITHIISILSLLTACSPSDSKKGNNNLAEKQDTVAVQKNDSVNNDSSTQAIVSNGGVKAENTGIRKLYEEVKSVADFPSWFDIKPDGNLIFGAKWTDMGEENVLILSRKEIEPVKGKDEKSIKFYAMHYVKKEEAKEKQLLWSVNDGVKDCAFDADLFYVPHSFTLSDLNGNGVRECIFMYQLQCRSDVSEDELKLVMHEGKEKYNMNGTTKVNTGTSTVGGQMTVDASFDKAPAGFKKYATDVWSRFVDVNKRIE